MTANPIRILLVDDHFRIHRAIAAMFDSLEDITLVGQASSGEEAVLLVDECQPDVILMDVNMPDMDGIEATRLIIDQHPTARILALSSYQDEDSVRSMLKAGAMGYILKYAPIDDLASTIRTAYSGNSVFSPEVTQVLLQPAPASPGADYGLTVREVEVLGLMVRGLNNTEIAAALVISLSTAKFHVSSILTKLGVSSRVEAVALAVEKNLIR